jgi:hypothetical protein
MTLRLIELLEPLEAGRSAAARLMKWDDSKKHYVASGEKITVYDFAGRHGIAHDRGYAALSSESQLWEVVSGLHTQEWESIV